MTLTPYAPLFCLKHINIDWINQVTGNISNNILDENDQYRAKSCSEFEYECLRNSLLMYPLAKHVLYQKAMLHFSRASPIAFSNVRRQCAYHIYC